MNFLDIDGSAVVRYLPGDLFAIFLFVLLGELQHTTLSLERYAGVLIPFLIGWLVIAPVIGAYSESAADSTRSAIGLAIVSWLGADFIGQIIRDMAFFPGSANPQFFLVAFVFAGLLLIVMRFVTLVIVTFNRS